MQPLHAAIYARVSSDQQTADNTIASQLAALETRLNRDQFETDSFSCRLG